MDIMLVEIFAKALLTCLILFMAARHEADLSWHKVLMINSRTYEIGNTVSIKHNGRTYTWRITGIGRHGPILEPVR